MDEETDDSFDSYDGIGSEESYDHGEQPMTPLVQAIKDSMPVSFIQGILDRSPEQMKRQVEGMHPMSHAVLEGSPVEVVRSLYKCWPESVTAKDIDDQCVPLHHVCYDTPVESVEFLVDVYAGALHLKTMMHGLPIHSSIDCKCAKPVVRVLAERYPESLLVRSKGRLPIHNALGSSSVNFELVEYLADRCPKSVREVARLKIFSGSTWRTVPKLPIHLAAESPGPYQLPIFQLLSSRFPESLDATTSGTFGDQDEDLLPIHLVAQAEGPSQEEVLEYLAYQRPESLVATTAHGHYPVHKALQSKRGVRVGVIRRLAVEAIPEETRRGLMHFTLRELERKQRLTSEFRGYSYLLNNARVLVEALPGTLRATDAEGSLPIHVTVLLTDARTPTMSLVRLFVAQHPDSLLHRNAAGATPLHVALEHARDMTMAEFLFESCPESAAVVGSNGNLPIHAALTNRWYGLVNRIVELSPAGSQGRGARGRTPAHVAATLQCDDEEGADQLLVAAAALVGSWPESLLERDADGNLPIHVAIACLTGDWACTFVRFLMERNRDSLRVADARGRLPLHVAVSKIDPSSQLAMQLVDEWDGALELRDASGSVPLQLAIANPTASLDLIYRLVRTRPDFVPDVLM